MATAPQPADLADIIRDLQRRVRSLETSPRVGYASIGPGQALVVVDAGGNQVLRIGQLNSGGFGIERWNGTAWVAIT